LKICFLAGSAAFLFAHLVKIIQVGLIHVLVTVSVNGVLVSFIVRQVVSSIASLHDTTSNHFRTDQLAIIDPAELCEQVNENCAEVVVANVTKFARAIVVGENVMIIVITKNNKRDSLS
jgi:hypothetical protein